MTQAHLQIDRLTPALGAVIRGVETSRKVIANLSFGVSELIFYPCHNDFGE